MSTRLVIMPPPADASPSARLRPSRVLPAAARASFRKFHKRQGVPRLGRPCSALGNRRVEFRQQLGGHLRAFDGLRAAPKRLADRSASTTGYPAIAFTV
jgi:hypothetical protein